MLKELCHVVPSLGSSLLELSRNISFFSLGLFSVSFIHQMIIYFIFLGRGE